MVGDDREFAAAAAMNVVGVAVTFSSGQIYEARGGEFIERHAVLVGRDIGALGLCDLCEIHANASEADGLSWSGSGIRSGHLLYVKEINTTHDDGCHEDKRKSSHERSVAQAGNRDKRFVAPLCGTASQ